MTGPSRGFNWKLVALITLFWAFLPGMALAGPAPAAENPREPAGSQEKVDFDACVRLALRQSPYFTKSSLEISIRRMDEKDSKADLIPAFTVRTRYYPVLPSQLGPNTNPYTFEIAADVFNPVEAYFSIKARQIVTRIAILAHNKIISDGLYRLGTAFLELEALDRLARLQAEMLGLAQKAVTYQQQLLKIGEVSSLEVKVAQQELEAVQNEDVRLRQAKIRGQESLKGYLALKKEQNLTFDLHQVQRQVLGSFDPAGVTLDAVKTRNQELKIEALKRELQSWKVTQSRAKLFPTFTASMSTPDPRSFADTRGYFFSIGLNWPIPVLDGFKSIRDITRQKTVLKQYESEGDLKDLDVEEKWRAALERLRAAAVALKAAQSNEELAQLRGRQAEIVYQSGRENFATWLRARKGILEAQALVIQRTLEYNTAQLSLRHLAGDLVYHYVDERLERQ